MKELAIRLAVGAAGVVVLAIAISWIATGNLSDPAPHVIGRPPLDLEASNITFASGSGTLIHGWLSHGTPGAGVVLLLHPARADRREMLSRAEFLRRQGFSVLLFDFQAHGDSRGQQVTFGARESRDVVAAIEYLHHQLPGERVGVIGVSMGAAAFVLADGRPRVAAMVLESLYPALGEAVTNELRPYLGPLASAVAALVLPQLRSRVGIEPARFRPADRMSRIDAPVFIVSGSADKYTPLDEERALFEAAPSPKQLWAVEGAGHVDLYAFAPAEYERRVGEFLQQYFRENGQH
jgi:uncharacterized protein